MSKRRLHPRPAETASRITGGVHVAEAAVRASKRGMRFPRRAWLSPARLGILAAVLLLAGWRVYGRVERRDMSPFALWDFRAGMPFEEIEETALAQTKQHFACQVAVVKTRLCELRVTGIAGRVRVLVDAQDRAAIVQFLPDSASPVMREEGRRIAAQWSLVRAGAPDRPTSPDGSVTTTRWSSEDGKWSSMMRYAPAANTPAIVHLADEAAVRTILRSAPLASLVLSLNDLVASPDSDNSRDIDRALAATLYGRVTDPAAATPAPVATTSSVSLCVPDPDPVVPGSDAVPQQIGPSMAAFLELAVPAAYPGSRLVLGNGLWIVDASGLSELVQLSGRDLQGADGIGVFAFYYPGRIRMAQHRIEEKRPERFCRAPAEVLFARRAEDGSLAEVHRIDIDADAIASDITRLGFSHPDYTDDPPHIRVRHTALYAADSWKGSIEWETVIAGDPPLPTGRVPLMFSKRAHNGEPAGEGTVVVTGRPTGTAIQLSTLEQHEWGFATRTVVVPLEGSGVLSGARFLAGLQ